LILFLDSGYQLSNNNYNVVVDVLKCKFGNPQLIINAISHTFLLAATNQTVSLRQTFDVIEHNLYSLEAMEEDINHRDFAALISEKLPQKVLYQLYMLKSDEEEWTVSKLWQLLENHITTLEMAGDEPHPTPILVKHITKYMQGGVSGQCLNLQEAC